MVEGTRLESGQTLIASREFESLPLRHARKERARRLAPWRRLTLALAAAALTIARPAAAQSGLHAWTHPDELRLYVAASPHTLNPVLTTNQEDIYLGSLAFDLLVTADARGNLLPDLAVEVPTLHNGGVSRDGLTITYKLRRNVRWHDGAPFTSGDVAFTYRTIMDPRSNIESRQGYDRIARIETPDPYTVRFRLKEKFAPFVRTIFSEGPNVYRIVPEHLLARERDINTAAFNAHPVGTGPYAFSRWIRGDRIEYMANPSYFGGKPHIARVVVREIPDQNTVGIEVRQHGLDFVRVDSATFAALRGLPDYTALLGPQNAFVSWVFNTTHPPLDDVRVRRAIVKLIDRPTLVRKNTYGTGIPALADIPPLFWTRRAPGDPNAYDVGAAKRLLDAAGWRVGAGGVRAKDGKALRLQLAEIAGSPTARSEDVQIQAALSEGGVAIDIKTFAAPQYFAPASQGGIVKGGDFDIAAFSWLSGIDLDNSELYTCGQRAPAGYNLARYCSHEMDDAQRAALATYDDRERQALYARIESLALRDVPALFAYYPQSRTIQNPDLHRPEGTFVEAWWDVKDWRFGS